MKNTIFCDIASFGLLKVNRKQSLPINRFSLGLFFDVEDIYDMFLRNVG
jgi:hypothetical protein